MYLLAVLAVLATGCTGCTGYGLHWLRAVLATGCTGCMANGPTLSLLQPRASSLLELRRGAASRIFPSGQHPQPAVINHRKERCFLVDTHCPHPPPPQGPERDKTPATSAPPSRRLHNSASSPPTITLPENPPSATCFDIANQKHSPAVHTQTDPPPPATPSSRALALI